MELYEELKAELNKNVIKVEETNNKRKNVLEKNINNEQHTAQINTEMIKNILSFKLANSNK